MQCACAMLSSMACTAVKHFSVLYNRGKIFENKKLLKVKCVF